MGGKASWASHYRGYRHLAYAAVLLIVCAASENAVAEGLYAGYGGTCSSIASCFALAAAYREVPENQGGVTFANCFDTGSHGPVPAWRAWGINILIACERMDPPPIGVYSNVQMSFFASDWPSECEQTPYAPVCPSPDGNYEIAEDADIPEKICPDPSNPCNPVNGNKSQRESDYDGGGIGALSFARYYNSSGVYKTAAGMPAGWRHTYSRAIEEKPDRKTKLAFKPSQTNSGIFATAQEACEVGWDRIKTTAYSGNLSTSTATFVGGNSCRISGSAGVLKHVPVRSNSGWSDLSPPPDLKTLTRPNGQGVRFVLDGSDWINEQNPALKLEASGDNWIYTDTSDTQETYNSGGQLVSITYRNGQTETLAYDLTAAQGGDDDPETLDLVTGPFGHTLTFSYDANGYLTVVTAPDGVYQYAMDVNDNLVSVTHPDTAVRQYVYEDANFPNHLTGIVDENGARFATWAYDEDGRAILSEHAGGQEQVQLAYNGNGTTTLTMANGAATTYTFSTQQGQQRLSSLSGDVCSTCPGGNIKDRSYDSNGFVAEVTDWNDNVTRTDRNARGLVETLTEGLGTTEERVTTTQWHATYRLPTTVTSPQNTTSYSYDANGNVTGITIAGGGKSRSWAFTYNANGQPLTINGPRTDVSDVTTLAYYDCSTGNECGQLASITNALGYVTAFDAYDGAGRVIQMTEPNGLVTTLSYDARGRVTSITETPPAGSARTTSMTYDGIGQLLTHSLPNGVVLTYTYTDAHYPASVTDNLGNRISYSYDVMGELIGEDSFDPANNLQHAIAYTNDVNYRLDTIESGGFTTDLSFDLVGNRIEEIEPGNATTQHVYDALNRLQTTTDALTGVTAFSYDDHDNLTQVAAPNGATTDYVYDGLSNLVAETSPDRGITTYTHDDAGNPLTATDARGIASTYTYDALNRLTSVSYPDSSENVVYAYDDAPSNGIGRMTSISDSSGTTTYTYDEFGNIATDVRQVSGMTYSTSYQYDAAGMVVSMTYPSGRTVDYGRNAAGQITQVTSTKSGVAKTIVSGASYEPFGPISGVTYGNGVSIDFERGTDYRIRGISSAGITEKTYFYDAAANVASIVDAATSFESQLFEYDALHRIVSEYSDYADFVLADDPLIYWRLGESSGSVAVNENPSGPDGTYGSAVLLGQPGLVADANSAIRIDSPTSNSYVASPTMTGTSLTGIEAWFRTDSLANRHIVGLTSNNHIRMLIHHLTDGTIGIWWYGNILLSSDYPVASNEIHHVALWYDSATNTSFMMVDGVTQQNTLSGNLLGVANARLFVGAYQWQGTVHTNMLGEIDEVAAYDSPVDATTFAGRYSFKSAGGGTTAPDYDEFVYDANGNRTSHENASGVETLSYLPLSNQLAAIDGSAILHDAVGNRTADQGGSRSFGYSDSNRLDEVFEYGASVATYVHNGLGQRTKKTANGADVTYIYDLFGNLIAEHSNDGTLLRDYVWLNNLPVGQIDAGEVFSYLHFDHLGTPRLATNDNQTVVWRWDSDAFGTTAADEDPDGDSSSTVVNLRFPGQYYDEETGFHYNYYRTYDPSTGRYLESDPIGILGGLNTYVYVSGNPLSGVDPLGLIEWHGTYYQASASRWYIGPTKYIFTLWSECVDGRKAYARVHANALGVGRSLNLGNSGGEITLRDPYDEIYLSELVGPFAAATSGIVYGGGVTAGSITVGQAESVGIASAAAGVEANLFTLALGFTELVDSSWADCPDECTAD